MKGQKNIPQRRAINMCDVDEKMYDHNKLLSLYQTDVNEARSYLDKHVWYFLDRVSWKISQYELDEMRSFAIAVVDEFAQRQLVKRDVLLDYPEANDIIPTKERKRVIDSLCSAWWWKYKYPIEWMTSESNRIGRYLLVTLRGRLMNKAKADSVFYDTHLPIDIMEVWEDEKDCISLDKTYNLISDAILSLNLSEKQVIWIHMHFIWWSSNNVCANELWMDAGEFRAMMKEVKYLIQQYIYDNTNTKASDR